MNPMLWTQPLAVTTEGAPAYWQQLSQAAVSTLVFGLIGILLAAFGYKVFDWITPKIDVEKELAEKQNVAVAIVIGAVILGVCTIIAVAVH